MKFLVKKRNHGLFFKIALGVILIVAVIGTLRLTKKSILEDFSFSQIINSQDGQVLRINLSGDQKYRFKAILSEINSRYITAVLEKEDRFFYYHLGINPISLVDALIDTYVTQSRRRGASTITMQLARLLSLEGSNHLFGKLKQIVLALFLETKYSKAEILEAYFTLAPFGRNVEGVKAAAFLYFGKSTDALTKNEIDQLIRLPQNPNAKALQLPMQTRFFLAPHFVDRINEFNVKSEFIQTTLNYRLQKKVEEKMSIFLQSQTRFGVDNAAALVLDLANGEIRSYLGSQDYKNINISGQVNGVKAQRSPGSLLKPFLYGMAIEQGIIHPQTLLKDLPTSFGLYDPENFDRTFRGPLSATLSLTESRNIPAVTLQKKIVGFVEFFRKFGVQNVKASEFYGYAAGLGGIETSLEEVGALYQLLSYRVSHPKLVFSKTENIEINYSDTHSFLLPESRYLVSQMLSENRLNSNLDLLKKDSDQVAWKTGTSYGFRDAWTAGIYDHYVIAVWIGNFSGEFNPAFRGRDLAAPLFFQIKETVKAERKYLEKYSSKTSPFERTAKDWILPENLNVAKVEVCSLSGGIATANCNHRKKTWFIPGKSPIHQCSIHQKIMVSKLTGLRKCKIDSDSIEKIFEIWPSDLVSLFGKAGLFLRSVPKYENTCDSFSLVNNSIIKDDGQFDGLKIVLPREGIKQVVTLQTQHDIFLKAAARSKVKKLDWFVDREYIGSSAPEEIMKWPAKIGKFNITLMDDSGEIVTQELEVELAN